MPARRTYYGYLLDVWTSLRMCAGTLCRRSRIPVFVFRGLSGRACRKSRVPTRELRVPVHPFYVWEPERQVPKRAADGDMANGEGSLLQRSSLEF
jgi:hypothetical protein